MKHFDRLLSLILSLVKVLCICAVGRPIYPKDKNIYRLICTFLLEAYNSVGDCGELVLLYPWHYPSLVVCCPFVRRLFYCLNFLFLSGEHDGL